ncbi:MAG: hypothetical protein OEX00_08685 [Gammaproteobacteria bacterium]|nr:hypothetical protein [Gammaproteobacteria bacterium]MDH5692407.1 hypothetical protein [Gammaproteobacteria bacterium]
MKKIFLCAFLAAFVFASPVMAEDSPREICTAEANEAGFEDQGEKDAYIADCMQSIASEGGASSPSGEEEASPSAE